MYDITNLNEQVNTLAQSMIQDTKKVSLINAKVNTIGGTNKTLTDTSKRIEEKVLQSEHAIQQVFDVQKAFNESSEDLNTRVTTALEKVSENSDRIADISDNVVKLIPNNESVLTAVKNRNDSYVSESTQIANKFIGITGTYKHLDENLKTFSKDVYKKISDYTATMDDVHLHGNTMYGQVMSKLTDIEELLNNITNQLVVHETKLQTSHDKINVLKTALTLVENKIDEKDLTPMGESQINQIFENMVEQGDTLLNHKLEDVTVELEVVPNEPEVQEVQEVAEIKKGFFARFFGK